MWLKSGSGAGYNLDFVASISITNDGSGYDVVLLDTTGAQIYTLGTYPNTTAGQTAATKAANSVMDTIGAIVVPESSDGDEG